MHVSSIVFFGSDLLGLSVFRHFRSSADQVFHEGLLFSFQVEMSVVSGPVPTPTQLLFDDRASPSPLFKRIRLSEEASSVHTEASEAITEPTVDSLMSDPILNGSLVFTPMASFATNENDAMFGLESKVPNSPKIQRTPLAERTSTLNHLSPVTPLPNYIEMMTPELKVS